MRTAHPLGLIAGGLAIVVLDVRTESLHLLLDPFGWLLVAVGAGVLRLRSLAADPIAYDPIWNGSAEYASLLGTLAMGWVGVELCFWVRRAWAVPEGYAQPSPWADPMLRDD